MKDSFDTTLSRRRFEAHRPDFAERIIQAANHREQQLPKGLGAWFGEWLQPRFAYAFAAVLMAGFVIGTELPSTTSAAQDNSSILQSWLHEEGDIL